MLIRIHLIFMVGPEGFEPSTSRFLRSAYELRQAFCRSSLAEHPGIRLGSESIRARAQHYTMAKVEYAFRWEVEWCSGRDFQRLLAFEPASLTVPGCSRGQHTFGVTHLDRAILGS